MSFDPNDLDIISDSPNPLDAVESVLSSYNLEYIRMDDDELILSVAGQHASYRLFLTWQDEFEALQIICQTSVTVGSADEINLSRLIMAANTQLWLGHFELSDENVIQFRYTTLLRAPLPGSGVDHMNDLFKLAVSECDRFYPAFKLLTDDVAPSEHTLAFAMQDVAGES